MALASSRTTTAFVVCTTWVLVLDFGTVIASGPTDDVLGDVAVRRAYLGDVV